MYCRATKAGVTLQCGVIVMAVPPPPKKKGTMGRWWHQVVARLETRLERREFLPPLMVARHCILLGCSLGAGMDNHQTSPTPKE